MNLLKKKSDSLLYNSFFPPATSSFYELYKVWNTSDGVLKLQIIMGHVIVTFSTFYSYFLWSNLSELKEVCHISEKSKNFS